jgi:hypothetical protein
MCTSNNSIEKQPVRNVYIDETALGMAWHFS